MGVKFEKDLFEKLATFFPKFKILSEKEIISNYGNDITGIDILLFNDLKPKDLGKKIYIHIFIQCKWINKTISIRDVNHFIQCYNQIIKMKDLNESDSYILYCSKLGLSKPSKDAFNKINNSFDIYENNMDNCITNIIKQISTILNVKPKIKNSNIEYKEDIIPISKSNENNMYKIIEFEKPTIRNNSEIKSKLLKISSELYLFLINIKNYLQNNGFSHNDRMGLHVEVLNNKDEPLHLFLERVNVLEGREINVKNDNNYDVVGRALVLKLGNLEGYNKIAKITIAYFEEDGKALKALDIVKDFIKNI